MRAILIYNSGQRKELTIPSRYVSTDTFPTAILHKGRNFAFVCTREMGYAAEYKETDLDVNSADLVTLL